VCDCALQESTIDELLSELDSETLADMLRFLSLELERIVDEQRIQAMKLLVERIRRTREAEESGTRQEEERRRRADDEIFRQVKAKFHYASLFGAGSGSEPAPNYLV